MKNENNDKDIKVKNILEDIEVSKEANIVETEEEREERERIEFEKLPDSKKVRKLKDKIKELKSERIIDLANLDNIRKQYEKDFNDRQKYAVSSFIKDILPALDTFNMAISSKNVSPEVANWLKGFEMVKNMLDQSLENNGVKEIKTSPGDEFDSKFHHAVDYIESSDYADDTIIKINQNGYMLRDRLLRPTSVVISKSKASESKTNNKIKEEDNK